MRKAPRRPQLPVASLLKDSGARASGATLGKRINKTEDFTQRAYILGWRSQIELRFPCYIEIPPAVPNRALRVFFDGRATVIEDYTTTFVCLNLSPAIPFVSRAEASRRPRPV